MVNSPILQTEEVIGTLFPSFFIDGFTERFNQIREEVLAGEGPRNFVYAANSFGCLVIRRCRIMRSRYGGLVIININHGVEA